MFNEFGRVNLIVNNAGVTLGAKTAARVIAGIKKNKHRVLIGPDAYLIDIWQRLMPTGYLKAQARYFSLADRLMKKRMT